MDEQQPTKQGYKTTEFWLTLAAGVLGTLFATGVIPADGAFGQIAGIVATILSALGYTVSRTMLKK